MAPKPPKRRCAWADTNPLFYDYHDHEWGTPLHAEQALFELLNLEGAQAGLSWATILAKREGYRRAFEGFDPEKVARFTAARRSRLVKDAGIVRNRLKIGAVVTNAKAFLALRKELGSFERYLWSFVDGKPLRGPRNREALAVSERMSKDLKARGFRFVGPTICYAFMQAAGLVNDHEPGCFRAPRR